MVTGPGDENEVTVQSLLDTESREILDAECGTVDEVVGVADGSGVGNELGAARRR